MRTDQQPFPIDVRTGWVDYSSRVLAAVDFSKPARRAFEYALALSQRHGAELVVVQAVPLNQALSWHARERFALTAKLQGRSRKCRVHGPGSTR